jgi:hypothetical protein
MHLHAIIPCPSFTNLFFEFVSKGRVLGLGLEVDMSMEVVYTFMRGRVGCIMLPEPFGSQGHFVVSGCSQ